MFFLWMVFLEIYRKKLVEKTGYAISLPPG